MLGTRPTMGIDVVCLAFSVELYLKDVHYAIEGEAPRGHDILKLFEKLSEQIQQEIFTYHTISKKAFCIIFKNHSIKLFTLNFSNK